MSAPHIVPLRDALDLELVGGKAINLAKLIQGGLPVPDGFVVTTAAFRAADDARVSQALATQISDALAGLDCQLVAARSSATAEDMAGASMAGQYESVLNLQGAAAVIAGVETCWRSLRSARTLAYLAEHDIDPDQVAMAVVVQQLVFAEIAGVLFTVDPHSGSREHMLIEASWGLGESLVSGDVQPDRIRIHASEAKVDSYQVASKTRALYPGESALQPVKAEDQDRACLSYEQIMRLRDLGQLAAKHFGAPQDIEWAIADDQVHVLQARPITTLAEADARTRILRDSKAELRDLRSQGHGPWVRHNLGETLPHPTPFTWPLVAHFMSGDGGFGKMHEDLGFTPGPAVRGGKSFLTRIAGEIYMDCSLMPEMFAADYPFAYDAELLRSDPNAAQNPPTLATGSLREIGDAAKRATAVTDMIRALSRDLDQTFDSDFVPAVLAWSKDQESRELAPLSNAELIALWQEQVEKVLGDFGNTAFLPSMVEAWAVEQLRTFLNEHSWDQEPDELLALLAVGPQPDSTIRANIELAEVVAGTRSLGAWLSDHGHRAPGEFELATPRWHERPEDAQRMAEQLTGADLADVHHQRLQAAAACVDSFKDRLSPSEHAELKSRVDCVQRYCRFREDGKNYLMRAYSLLRRSALEFGRRLAIGEDVFFLAPDEVFDALHTGFVPKGKIVSRQLDYAVEPRLRLPHFIDSVEIETLGSAPIRADGPALQASGVSSGSATGPVVIVRSPEAVRDLPPGAILVCPSTDPAWTPLFARAAGLVLERGGSLSHGAVVAREMGLPALVLDGATELFAEGEAITIDASAGWIYRDGADTPDVSADTRIPRADIPPPPGARERKSNRAGLLAAIVWGLVLALIYLLPKLLLHDPVMSLIDVAVWPLVRVLGMIGAVAAVAAVFGLLPIIGQRLFTDNPRLLEAKRRAARLRKAANSLPPDNPHRQQLEALAAPTTIRLLKASMVPLAFILGPMIMVFMWFPIRVDPASWPAEPGRMTSIVVEIDGECRDSVSLSLADPLILDSSTPAAQTLPAIRQELEELRREWQAPSDLSALPWEVQSAGDHTRQTMLASLNTYLAEGVPPLPLTWLITIPETATGAHPATLTIGDQVAAEFTLIFGRSTPPTLGDILPRHDFLQTVTINYPRPLHKSQFCAPFGWDLGWLGVYLLVYLPAMFIAKFALKVA